MKFIFIYLLFLSQGIVCSFNGKCHTYIRFLFVSCLFLFSTQERFFLSFLFFSFSSKLNLFNLFWHFIHVVNDLFFFLFFCLLFFFCHLFTTPNYLYTTNEKINRQKKKSFSISVSNQRQTRHPFLLSRRKKERNAMLI
jgi:hypothetical protein